MSARQRVGTITWRGADAERKAASASLAGLPPVLTVEEAARVLRIGRRLAYEQARIYLATDGAEGLPVMRLGRTLRVPTAALVELLRARPEPPAPVPHVELAPVRQAR